MRSYKNTISGTKCHVSVICRKRSVVAVVSTHGLLRALDDARFLLAWFTRQLQAAVEVLRRHPESAAGMTGMPEPACSAASPSGLGLGGPGSGKPFGIF